LHREAFTYKTAAEIAAPKRDLSTKGKKMKDISQGFFLRNHQRQNMPKWRKICGITTIDLDAATSIRFTTLSCKRQ